MDRNSRTPESTADWLTKDMYAMNEWNLDYKLFCMCNCRVYSDFDKYKKEVEEYLNEKQ